MVQTWTGSRARVIRVGKCTSALTSRARTTQVAQEEFVDYYEWLSPNVDHDDYFELMMRNAWHMSGGSGVCANTSCLRVLVTHKDGRQSVEEVKNDLGIKATDTEKIMANLKSQGLEPVKIETSY